MKSPLLNLIFKNKLNKILFFGFISLLIFIFSRHFVMFWDNVLFTSKLGNVLYTNGVFNWHIPDSFDPGHPPFLAFLLANAWNAFGHNLLVSHLVMLPFNIGLLYQLHKLVSFYVKDHFYLQFFALLLLVSDPTLSAQFVLVNPEIITLFFFFLSINAILYEHYYLKIVGLFFLSIVSFRSMMLAGGVFLFDFFNYLLIKKQRIKSFFNLKFIISYILGALSSIIYLSWRVFSIGWIHTRPNSPHEKIWFVAPLKSFIHNVIVLAHRYLDFGRIFIYIFIIFSFILFRKKIFSKEINQLLLLALTSAIIVIITSLFAVNPMGHRYFLASYLFLSLIAFLIINKFYSKKKLIYSFLLIGLITGNLWIYPRNIAQGWDASLAHVPYHSLRFKAIDYLLENNIKIENTATFYPNITVTDNVDLTGNKASFQSFNGENKYVLYSNVYNLSDENYTDLDTNYTILKKFEKFRIHIYIYKLKE